MNPTVPDRSPRRGIAALAVCAAVVLVQVPFQASATNHLPTPAVELVDTGADAGDGFVNAAESTDLYIKVTYDPNLTPVKANGRIVGTTATPCASSAPHTTANQDGLIDQGGSFLIGPFDVTGFAEGVELCARAFVQYAPQGQSPSGTSNTAILDTVAPPAGTLEMIEQSSEGFLVDGYLNRVETNNRCCIDANSVPAVGSDAITSTVWFTDSTGTPSSCGSWTVAHNNLGALPAQCGKDLAEGPFTFDGYWSDAAGNDSPTVSSAPIIKDSIRPVTSYITPTAGQGFAPGSTVTVNATTEPFSTLQFRLDNVVIGSDTAAADGSFTFAFPAPAALGTHQFRTIATDLASNVRGTNLLFEVDDLIPVITAPANGSLQNSTVTIRGTGRPLSSIEVLEAGGLVGSTTVDSNGDWVLVTGMTDGPHTITARATDASSTSDESLPVSFLVDAGRPVVQITTANNSLQPSAPLIEGTASDGGEGVVRVRVSYFNQFGTRVFQHDAACTTCGAGATSVTWQSDPVFGLPGIYTVVAEAIDAAGNVSPPQSIRLIAGP